VINMVINGEKAPAFNARTLTLPTPQIDNTGRIIENTRRKYSRSRAEVEQEISLAIKPLSYNNDVQQKPPSAPARNNIKWPIGIKPIAQDLPVETGKVTTKNSSTIVAEPKPKRKRSRSRKKKNESTTPLISASSTDSNASTVNPSGDTLKIKH